jgi:glycosyltransferase involved in cell wall biosynthesis
MNPLRSMVHNALLGFSMAQTTSTERRCPLLLISDAPSSSSGLGRITRELAIRIQEHLSDVCRLSVLGYGGPGSRSFGFTQYSIEGMVDWIVPSLPEVWEDFAGDEKGIVMTVWDASRLMWFSQPARCEMLNGNPIFRNWLINAPFKRWGYFPIDAEGPNEKLSFPLVQTLLGFDKILAYGEWGRQVVQRSIGEEQSRIRTLDALPHGIDTNVFYERDRAQCRQKFGSITGARLLIHAPQLLSIMENEVLVGIVATNQPRKDWALGIQAAALLAKERKLRLWIHTDGLERAWSIPALLADYGLLDRAMISTGFLSDDDMAQAYSACDLTLGIGPEGWGLPLGESLACGTPVITGSYAGGAEITPKEMHVEPIAYRLEGLYACVRPVFNVNDWVERSIQNLDKRASLDPQYAWKNLWPRWEAWFRRNIDEQ